MIRSLLIRGMLVGILAGLLSFGFARIFGEPQVDRAIAFETAMDVASGGSGTTQQSASMSGMDMSSHEADPELVTRSTQATIGLLTAVVVYATAFGGLFAVAFCFLYGRLGTLGPRATAAVLGVAGFVGIYLVPSFKYPANPPAVGLPETIGYRTSLFFGMIVISLLALAVAAMLRRHLAPRFGGWNATMLGGMAFIVFVMVAQFFLPSINEVPEGFPATVLWNFRMASAGTEAILWATLGLGFGALAEKVLIGKGRVAITKFRET